MDTDGPGNGEPDDRRIGVAVVIERVAAPNRWQDWAFRLVDVIPDPIGREGVGARLIREDGSVTSWLHGGHTLELFPDECKGYFLNLTSGAPAWFVSWVPCEGDASQVQVTGVSVSYIEADRRMFAEERVENVPLAPELCEWLRLFTNRHFKPDTARKVRAQSFLAPSQRQADADRLSGGGCDV